MIPNGVRNLSASDDCQKSEFGRRMKLQKERILPAIHTALEARREIQFAYLFGSFAEGEKFRDLDVAVYISDPELVKKDIDYSIPLSVELELLTGYPVDVILMNSAPDHLIHSISKGMVLVDRDEDYR
ncbi:MAG: nucleotidyltransferase domain-containing protein, partial [Ignavibacteriae bacterium]|nr:nucleotidyltransferase domain-containing protein [Ignavibacteriota bacterium]